MTDQMTKETATPLMLYIPSLHKELLCSALPAGVMFFDPGATRDVEESAFRPQGLPLNPVQARRTLAGLLHFGEQAQKPGDLAWMGVSEPEGIESRDAVALRGEFNALKRFAGEPPSPEALLSSDGEEVVDHARLRAQTLLLLAWSLEGQVVEVERATARCQQASVRFSESLGVEPDETSGASFAPGVYDLEGHAPFLFPWRVILESMLLFLRPGTHLVCSDKDIHETWCEGGIQFEPAEQGQCKGMAEMPGACMASVSGWRLLGLRGPRPDAPWLEAVYRILYLPG